MKGMFELDELQNSPEKENLLLVDCLNLSFRYMHRKQHDFAGDFLRTISSLAKSYGARDVVLLSDKGSSSFRLEVDSGYKSDRKEKHKEKSEEEKEEFRKFFEGYERALELASNTYPLVRMSKVEADDLAAYIVRHHSHKYDHTWLISSDGDWDLLLSENVSRFSFVTRKEYTLQDFYINSGCDSPEEFVSVKALQGDSGDSIPGIPGVGVKRAYNLVREYGSAFELAESIPVPGKRKIDENINKSKDRILTNIMLVDLLSFCEDAISHPNVDNLKELEEFCNERLR